MGGERRKLLYARGGRLLDALTLEPIAEWRPARESLEASEYRVTLWTADGRRTAIVEDEQGVWIEEGDDRRAVTRGRRVRLPKFRGHPFAPWLRALHAELLVNILPFGPVPNLWVYPRPWYRDAAMILMCLEKTGNLPLVEAWVMGLSRVFDRNNNGESEADNLGQVLYMASLFGAVRHPIVKQVLRSVAAFRSGDHIVGRTDGGEKPVYQTKWLKFGLRSLGLDDPWRIPPVYDPYGALFWMDYREEHVPGPRCSPELLPRYPYLHWAEAHFFGEPPPEPLEDLRPPLTRESEASEAEYWRLKRLAEIGILPARHCRERTARPHTWHAAEMFLYLLDRGVNRPRAES